MKKETTTGIAIKPEKWTSGHESRGSIEISAPLFVRGDKVMALNRRARGKGKHTKYANPGRWERAMIEATLYNPDSPEYYRWTYKIIFDRRSYNGHPLRLTVIDDEIKHYA